MKKRIAALIAVVVLSVVGVYAQLDKPYFYLRGRDYIMSGQYRSAIESLNLLLRALPEEYEGYFLRGVAKYNLNDLQGALQDFSSAIFYNPAYPMAYQYRGITQSRLGQYDEALGDFDRAIELRPGAPGTFYSRAVTHFLNQQFSRAVADYTRFLRLEPSDAQGYVNRGTAYLYASDTVAALSDYNRAIKVNPYVPDSYLRRGLVSMVQGKTTEGVEDMNRTLSLDSTFSIAYFYRAMGNNTLGKLNASLSDFDQAIRYDSTNSVSYFNRALLRTQVGDYNRAVADYSRVAAANPDNVLVYYNRGSVYALLGDLKRAASDYTTAIRLYPDFANAYMHRSQIRLMMGDRKGSQADYTTATRKIEEYRRKMTPEAFEQYADTSQRFSKIMSFDADFGNKDFSRLQGQRRSVFTPKGLYSLSFAPDDSTITAVDPRRYRGKRVSDFLTATGLADGLRLSNRATDWSVGRIASRDSILASRSGWGELFERAILQSLVSQYASAINTYNYLASERPNDPFVLLNRAATRASMIEFMASLDGDYQNIAVDSDPAARLKASEKVQYDYTAVEADLRAAIALASDLPHVHYDLGYVLSKQGRLTEAVEAYTKALELFPYFGDAYYNRGIVQVMLGEEVKAGLDMSRAGELGVREAYDILSKLKLAGDK